MHTELQEIEINKHLASINGWSCLLSDMAHAVLRHSTNDSQEWEDSDVHGATSGARTDDGVRYQLHGAYVDN